LGHYTPNLVTDQALSALLSEAAQAQTEGVITWTARKPHIREGKIVVRTALSDCPLGHLRVYYVDPRPSEISCQYLVNGAPVRRLDVNGSHRDVVNVTHKHTYVPALGTESFYYPSDIPVVPLGPTVAPGTCRAVFEAFAAECFILLNDGYWEEP
jgi:hypothetical protein